MPIKLTRKLLWQILKSPKNECGLHSVSYFMIKPYYEYITVADKMEIRRSNIRGESHIDFRTQSVIMTFGGRGGGGGLLLMTY